MIYLGQAAALKLYGDKDLDGQMHLYVGMGEYSASLLCAANEGELCHNRTGEPMDLNPVDDLTCQRWMNDYDSWVKYAEERWP